MANIWSISCTFTENNASIASLTGGTKFILGRSKVGFTVTITVREYGTGLDRITIKYGNKTKTINNISADALVPVYTFTEPGTEVLDWNYVNITATCLGSKSENVMTVRTIDVYTYNPPIIRANVERVGGNDADKCVIDLWGYAFSGSFGAVANSLTVTYKYRQVGASSYTTGSGTYVPTIGDRIQPELGNYNGEWALNVILPETFDTDKQYEIVFTATDELGSAQSATILYDYMPLWAEFPEKFCVYGELHVHDRSNPSSYANIRAGLFPVGTILRLDYNMTTTQVNEWFGGTWYREGEEQIDPTPGSTVTVALFRRSA